ncbi:TAL1 [Coprinopsis cinerea AmutBmut pab1-1]|nr:TAL1 [Coprinopsis cinerea AmutBmut pab1-1]
MPALLTPSLNNAPDSITTGLDYVRRSGILIASDGAEYNRIAEFDPLDATSNPSLVLAAVSKPEYAHLIDEAVDYSVKKGGDLNEEERTTLALLKLLVLVGVQILSIIPGRVSASVDPRTGYSIPAILSQARTIISLFEENSIPRSRILVKIPGTPEGISAAHTLEHPTDGSEPIHTNITLIFGRAQALACAQADLSVISPFVGRVKDWWDAQGFSLTERDPHPGMALVSSIQRAYARYGYKGKTEVMAAGFRKPEEVLAMAAGLGRPDEAFEVVPDSMKGWKRGTFLAADLVTIPPELLAGLRSWTFPAKPPTVAKTRSQETEVDEDTEPVYFEARLGLTTSLYENTLKNSKTERIVLDKVSEGLQKFSADAVKLEDIVRDKVLAALRR